MQKVIEYRCLIISPSDLVKARNAIEQSIVNWNAQVGKVLRARVQPIRWESSARPELGDRPQEIFNSQIVDGADLGVCLFWSRLGTPTGIYESGSVEEIEELRKRGKPVLLYFSTAKVLRKLLPTTNSGNFRKSSAAISNRGSSGASRRWASCEKNFFSI